MTRATQISRVVFGLLVLATFFAFFAAQRLKNTDALVYSVNIKRYISPNADGVRDKGRVRFRTKKADVVRVEVVDRTGSPVRVLADDEKLAAGPHTFYWNGRYRGFLDSQGNKNRGAAVADGAYRVRITMRDNGRTFVPDQFFVVDTVAPKLSATVNGGHTISILQQRKPVNVDFNGVEGTRRAVFLVYRVRGQRTGAKPVASFFSERGKNSGTWDQTVGYFREWSEPCLGVMRSGRARPAPVGSYVVIAKACDAAGNEGTSSTALPPRAGTTRGLSGITLTGVQIAPPIKPAVIDTRASFRVNPPSGGYSYRLQRVGGPAIASGRARGATLRVDIPRTSPGLYTLRVAARRPVRGDRGIARTPVAITAGRNKKLLIVQPSIAWQATNPVDTTGDGFSDAYPQLPPGKQLRVALNRFLALQTGTVGFETQEGALSEYLTTAQPELDAQTTTDAAMAADPAAALKNHDSILFTGDERWITAELGVALRAFVQRGGKVAFFSQDAFRRTVSLNATDMVGPTEHRQRDIFGETVEAVTEAPAPVVAFKDELGLLRGPTGLFTTFEQSRQQATSAQILTAAGREAGAPALIGYKLDKGTVIRVGVRGWSAELANAEQPNVAYTTAAIIEVLTR
ncbi:MAG: N,N-dimethylformamidase beta subunit family domain-containing protein [Solirubrobacterales bacterium]